MNSFTAKEIKMAIGIATDKRYKGGNMTGAVEAIEKIKKGLSKHPQVAAVLQRVNEELDLIEGRTREEVDGSDPDKQSAYQKFFAKELAKRGVKSPAELSDADKKKFYDYIDANWKAEKESD
jgi:hypothetical protein